MTTEKIIGFLQEVREPIAEYQDAKGLPKAEKYAFTTLMTALCQNTYNALINILTMLYNMLPLVDGFTFLLRFLLDAIIDILEAEDNREKLKKSVILVGELIVLFFVVSFIMTLLLMPIITLTTFFVKKFFHVISVAK